MTLKEFLNSNLLPRREAMPDVFSNEPYWALTDNLSVYSEGFNNTTYDKQSKPLIQNLQDMTPEKYSELYKYGECEVVRVNVIGDTEGHVATHIQIRVDKVK